MHASALDGLEDEGNVHSSALNGIEDEANVHCADLGGVEGKGNVYSAGLDGLDSLCMHALTPDGLQPVYAAPPAAVTMLLFLSCRSERISFKDLALRTGEMCTLRLWMAILKM